MEESLYERMMRETHSAFSLPRHYDGYRVSGDYGYHHAYLQYPDPLPYQVRETNDKLLLLL